MILAGTGTAGFLLKWFARINDGMRLAGIDNLDNHTPAIRRTLWSDAQAEYKLPEDITTTIYQFGFSEEDNQVRRYAYRSTSNFDSELLAAGLATKPACDVPDNWTFPNDLVTLMENQRERQATQPIGKRVFIGGEIQFMHLTRDNITISTIHRFDEYEQDLDKILRG